MGNLGRPGYGATTDGLWPYSYVSSSSSLLFVSVSNPLPPPSPTFASSPHFSSSQSRHPPNSYDSCDLGTFPNQTTADGSGPAGTLETTASSTKWDHHLSWLPGQRLRWVFAFLRFFLLRSVFCFSVGWGWGLGVRGLEFEYVSVRVRGVRMCVRCSALKPSSVGGGCMRPDRTLHALRGTVYALSARIHALTGKRIWYSGVGVCDAQ